MPDVLVVMTVRYPAKVALREVYGFLALVADANGSHTDCRTGRWPRWSGEILTGEDHFVYAGAVGHVLEQLNVEAQ